jgi:type II secretory pathway pseudopilin PulG
MTRTRPGFMLIELLVALTLSTLIAGSAILIWHEVWHTTVEFTDECALSSAMAGALDHLGRDIRSATSAEIITENGHERLVLHAAGGLVVTWESIVAPPDAPEQTRLRRHETGSDPQELAVDGVDLATFSMPSGGANRQPPGVEILLRIAAQVNSAGQVLSPACEVRTTYHLRCEEKP